MTTDNKFCPNCGERVDVSANFCGACGYSLEEKTAPTTPTPQASSEPVSGESIQGLLKRKETQLGLVVAAIIALAYFLIGGVDIAGNYISDNGDMVKIARNGKVTVIQSNYEGSTELIFYVEESSVDNNVYTSRAEKGLDVEITMDKMGLIATYGFDDDEYAQEIARELGLKVKETNNSYIISGTFTAERARAIDFDLAEFAIELAEYENGVYMGYEFYQKQ